jgi:RNA polymerase sigma-70 factor (ECF subfamily)
MMAPIADDTVQIKPSFDSLFERHGRELYAYLWRLLYVRQDAEDCLQETFLRAYRAFERTKPGWNYRAWLYKIATNVARTYMKRERTEKIELDELEDDLSTNPLETISHDEQVRAVLSAMRSLSFRQRTAIMMRKYNDLDYGMIGEVLGCTPETARAHVYQGLKRLRDRLAPTNDKDGNHDG